ncbi:hypothetical protein PAXRUDRAFT_830862, partial [Paxillus rubicundulus Ve08.2h10]
MRCDESPHEFQAGAATLGCEKAEVQLRGRGKVEVRTPGRGKRSWCSGSRVHCILS